MNKDTLLYLQNIINNMFSEDGIIKVIKKNYTFMISEEEFNSFTLPDNTRRFYFKYSTESIVEAYAPFLNIIRQLINENGIDVNRVLEQVRVYPLNREAISSYVLTGRARGREPELVGEKEYNAKRITDDIVNILFYLSRKTRIFILIAEANLMFDSSARIFRELIDASNDNLRILYLSNDTGKINESVCNLLDACDARRLVYEWPFEVLDTDKINYASLSLTGDIGELDTIYSMVYTHAWVQAREYLSMMFRKVEIEGMRVSDDYRNELYTLYMTVCIYDEDYSNTLDLVDKFSEIDFGISSLKMKYICCYYRACAYMYMGNIKESERLAVRCHEYSLSLNDEHMILASELLLNMSLLRGWKEVWVCDNIIQPADEFISRLEKAGYLNNLAHIYIYCFDNDISLFASMEDEIGTGIEERMKTAIKGIRLAEQLDNEMCILEFYKKNVMMASFNGYFKLTDYFYRRLMDVSRKIGTDYEEGDTYNGIGYISMAYDKFLEANRYFNSALRIFMDNGINNYVIETVYNMGHNAYLAGDYVHAIERFKLVMNMLSGFKKDRIRVSNVSKILELLALSYYKQGDIYYMQMYFNRTRQFLISADVLNGNMDQLSLWDDDLFLYYILCAILDTGRKDFESAFKNYDNAEYYLKRSKGSHFSNYYNFVQEKSLTLYLAGRFDESKELINNTILHYKKMNNTDKQRLFEEKLNNIYFSPPPLCIDFNDITMENVKRYMETQILMNEARIRLARIHFFDTFQQLINNEYESMDKTIKTLVSSFKSNFNIDNVLYVRCMKDRTFIKYSDIPYTISDESLVVMKDYFKDNNNGFVVTQYSNNYSEFQPVLNIFSKSKVFSLAGIPIYKNERIYCYFIAFIEIPAAWNSVIRDTLDNEDLEIFKIIFRQIIDAVEKYKMRQTLISQAVTDELTGLYNRKGFYELIDRMVERSQTSGEQLDCTIMYLDLDHFKYYNDTFGHSVGDIIIREFADMFRNVSEGIGDVIRFGGDEFLIVICSNDIDTINGIIDRIYSSINKSDGFEKLVADATGTQVNIPSELRASCSIGIAMARNVTDAETINEIQMNADKALYNVKENGRGRAEFYQM